jgi:hypothetical protein
MAPPPSEMKAHFVTTILQYHPEKTYQENGKKRKKEGKESKNERKELVSNRF